MIILLIVILIIITYLIKLLHDKKQIINICININKDISINTNRDISINTNKDISINTNKDNRINTNKDNRINTNKDNRINTNKDTFINIPQLKKSKSIYNITRNYSVTYENLYYTIPPDTTASLFVKELIYNKKHNIMCCCNPYCKKPIKEIELLCFDGYYCSHKCRHHAFNQLAFYWHKIV